MGGDVANFDTINFTLPANIAGNDIMLSIGGSADFPKPSSTATTKVNVAVTGAPALKVDDTITLISATKSLSITPTSTTITAGDYEFALSTDANSLTAKVTKAPPVIHAITYKSNGNGTLENCTPDSVEDGQNASISCTASPNGGYKLDGLSITGGNSSDSCDKDTVTCSATNVTATLTVTATFTKKKYKVNPTAGSGGNVNCNPPDEVEHGGAVECTATANTGSRLEKLEISDGVAAPATCTASPSCTAKLTGVKDKVTASATFKASGGGGGFDPAVISIDGDASNTTLLQPGKANAVKFTLGAPFDGSGTLELVAQFPGRPPMVIQKLGETTAPQAA